MDYTAYRISRMRFFTSGRVDKLILVDLADKEQSLRIMPKISGLGMGILAMMGTRIALTNLRL